MMGVALGRVEKGAVIQTLNLTYQIALKTIIRKLENGMWIACGRGMWDRVWDRVYDDLRDNVCDNLLNSMWDSMWDGVR